MKLLGFEISRSAAAVPPSPVQAEETRSLETVSQSATADEFFSFFGIGGIELPAVTVESALTVPAVLCAVTFLSRTLAALPLQLFKNTTEGPEQVTSGLGIVIEEAPNPYWSGFEARRYFWQQVFTRGRGLFWIERNAGNQPVALWPMNVARTSVHMRMGQRIYSFDGREYPSADVIDVPFMLKDDQCGSWSPISRGADAIQIALGLQAYTKKFVGNGGVPPLALEGPLPQGAENLKRAMTEIYRAVEAAQKSQKPIFPMPPGHTLKQVGFEPDKGQVVEGRQFQVEEIARVFQMPPVFLQDLTHGSFTNTEQQDVFLVKHLIGQWCDAFEEEANLKLFGQRNNRRYVRHDMDGLQRGVFKDRIEALARGIQTGQLTPNEARLKEGRAKNSNPAADELLVQGATVPLGTPAKKEPPNEPGNPDPQQTD